jgi:hypothetical protein
LGQIAISIFDFKRNKFVALRERSASLKPAANFDGVSLNITMMETAQNNKKTWIERVWLKRKSLILEQGCQIFLGTKYQNGKNITNDL